MRRGEVCGLRWKMIDFNENTITINHTVAVTYIDGKKHIVASCSAGKEKLLALKEKQEMFRKKFKKSYITEYLDYVCVEKFGKLIFPDYITDALPRLLEKDVLRKIRFHDLRHTCASLLLKNGVPMKQIQEWLGHSDFSTTANIYSHLDYHSKISSANAMLEAVNIL